MNTRELPKRSRYYQGMMDLQLIDSGQPYKKLNQSYVIFICLEDVFGKNRHIYTFENICREDPEIKLRDGAIKIFLNAKGNLNDVSSELRAFLDYLGGKKSEDEYVQKLEKAVREAKRNRKWRHEYMTLLMRDQENQEIGEERGRREGKQEEAERYSQLILKLVEEHKESMITEIAENSELREKLYRQYDL